MNARILVDYHVLIKAFSLKHCLRKSLVDGQLFRAIIM